MNLKQSVYYLIFLFTLLFATNQFAYSQTKIDSLNKAIESEHEIVEKARLYLSLSLEYKLTDLNKSKEIAKQALLFSEKGENDAISGLIYAHLGDIAFLQDSLNKAQREYSYAVPLLQESGELKRLIRVYLSMGNRFVEKGNYPEAMDYYLKGLSISDQISDSTYLPNLFNNLGVVYLNINDHQKALSYYARALPLFEKLHDTMNVAGATTNIGSIYFQLNEYDIARQYYQKGYQIFKSFNLFAGQAHALFKLGLLDIKQERYEDALQNLLESKELQISGVENAPGSKSMFLSETNINL